MKTVVVGLSDKLATRALSLVAIKALFYLFFYRCIIKQPMYQRPYDTP